MSYSLIKINGKIDKVLKVEEDGPTIVLFKNEEDSVLNLNSSILMVEITKRQWKKFKDIQNVLDLFFTVTGRFEIRKKNDKPYLYIKATSIDKLKSKSKKAVIEKFEKTSENYINEIQVQEREDKEIELKNEAIRKKKLEDQREDKFWFKKIEASQFVEIDISKVKLINKIHLNSIVPIQNIKRVNKTKRVNPIAVKIIDNSEEYELITGLRSFILAKLLSLKVKAYITDLDRDTFKEKYSLEK